MAVASRTIDSYEKLGKVGKGTYGKVYKARDKETGEIVALKKFLLDINEPQTFPFTAKGELKILSKLNHENVIKLKGTIKTPPDGNNKKGGVYMVYEYMQHDLAGLLYYPAWIKSLTPPQIKCYMKQLLTGLHYCHVNKILHRDIKASNLLMNNEGILKLADFGLAKSFRGIRSDQKLTNKVISFWYRPPELLLGAIKYGTAVDIWSAGCILAELHTGQSIFSGKTEADTLNHIFELCGAPDETNWPGVSHLPFYTKMKPSRPMPRRLREVFKHFGKHALDLLERMLTLDPNQRISAEEALDADYFRTDPLPSDPKSLPKFEPSHFYEIEKKRKRLKNAVQQNMPPSTTHYGSQSESSSLHSQSSRPNSPSAPPCPCSPPPPPPHWSRDMPSFGSQGTSESGSGYKGGAPDYPKGYELSHGSRRMPSSGSQGTSESGSGHRGGAPDYPKGYELSRGSRGMPSSSFHGAGGSRSAYGGGAPNYPPGFGPPSHGSKDVSSYGSHGGGNNGSAYEGEYLNYPLEFGPSHHESRDVSSSGSHGGGNSSSAYEGKYPKYPPGFGPSHGSKDVSSSGSYGGGNSGSTYEGKYRNYPTGFGPSNGSRDVASSGSHGGGDSGGSAYEGKYPNYPPGFGPSHGSRDVSSSTSQGGGSNKGSAYQGKYPNYPPGFGQSNGSKYVSSSGSHGGGNSSSGYGGEAPNYAQWYKLAHGSRDVSSSGSHGGGRGGSGSAYESGAPNQPQGVKVVHW